MIEVFEEENKYVIKIKQGVEFMAQNEKRDITRVNMNLPTKIVLQVKEYAEELGLPITQAYTVLLNQSLEQKDMLKDFLMILVIF